MVKSLDSKHLAKYSYGKISYIQNQNYYKIKKLKEELLQYYELQSLFHCGFYLIGIPVIENGELNEQIPFKIQMFNMNNKRTNRHSKEIGNIFIFFIKKMYRY